MDRDAFKGPTAAAITEFQSGAGVVELRRLFQLLQGHGGELRQQEQTLWISLQSLCAKGLLAWGLAEEDVPALSDATQAYANLLEAAASNPNAVTWQANLSLALRLRFELGGDVADIENAIEHAEKAVERTSLGDEARAEVDSTLAGHLRARWEASHDPADLERAIAVLEGALARTDPSLPTALLIEVNLGGALIQQDGAMGNDAAIERACAVLGNAFHRADARSAHRTKICSHYGQALLRRHQRSGDLTMLHAAIEALRAGLVPPDDGDPPTLAVNLGSALLELHDVDADRSLLAEAAMVLSRLGDPDDPTVERGSAVHLLFARLLVAKALHERIPDHLRLAELHRLTALACQPDELEVHEHVHSLRSQVVAARDVLLGSGAYGPGAAALTETATTALRSLRPPLWRRIWWFVTRAQHDLYPRSRDIRGLIAFVSARSTQERVAASEELEWNRILVLCSFLERAAAAAYESGQIELARCLMEGEEALWRYFLRANVSGHLAVTFIPMILDGARRGDDHTPIATALEALLVEEGWAERLAALAHCPEVPDWADFLDMCGRDFPALLAPAARWLHLTAELLRLVARSTPVNAIAIFHGIARANVSARWKALGAASSRLETRGDFDAWLQREETDHVRLGNHSVGMGRTSRAMLGDPMKTPEALRSEKEMSLILLASRAAKLERARADHLRAKQLVARCEEKEGKLGLYLRSFGGEATEGTTTVSGKPEYFVTFTVDRRLEDLLGSLCHGRVALVGIANPLDELRSEAIPKMYPPRHEWRPVVKHLIERAAVIVLCVDGPSAGVADELAMIEEANQQAVTLIVLGKPREGLPGRASAKQFRWLPKHYARLSRAGRVVHGRALDAADLQAALARCSTQNTPKAVTDATSSDMPRAKLTSR